MHSLAHAALQAHLARLLTCATISIVLGFAVALVRPLWRPFGVMTAVWGAIDAVIALASGTDSRPSADQIIPVIALNEGLDAGYVGVGIAMLFLAGERKTIKGFGLAVAIQGALLLILDGKLWSDLVYATLFR